MLKIRLQRVGRKNDASFRVVVIESQRGPKAGGALEILGFYDPKKDVVEIKGDRVVYWMSVGAQVSPTVHNLLISKNITKGKKINVLPKKSLIKKEETKKENPESDEQNKKKPDNEMSEENSQAVSKEIAEVTNITEEKNSDDEIKKEDSKTKEKDEKFPETEKSSATTEEEEK